MSLLESLRNDLLRAMNLLGAMQKQKLYDKSYSFIGTDASPRDEAPDDYACAESLCKVIQAAFPELNFPTILSTRGLFLYFIQSPSFNKVTTPSKGSIIINITGSGNGVVKNGHCGVVGKAWIMSNDSRTGTWEANFTFEGWERFYKTRGGMETHYFDVV